MHTFIILMLVIWCGCCFASLLLLCCCCVSCFSIRLCRLFGLVFTMIVLSAASTHRTNNRKLDTFALALTHVRFCYNFVNASFRMKWIYVFFFFFFIYFDLTVDEFVELIVYGLLSFTFLFVFLWKMCFLIAFFVFLKALEAVVWKSFFINEEDPTLF